MAGCVGVFFNFRRLLQVTSMKLSYRGVRYDLIPSLKTPSGDVSGTYRGVSWQFQQGNGSNNTCQCDRCGFYSGDPHLLCAVHPDGPGGDRCPDFELN